MVRSRKLWPEISAAAARTCASCARSNGPRDSWFRERKRSDEDHGTHSETVSQRHRRLIVSFNFFPRLDLFAQIHGRYRAPRRTRHNSIRGSPSHRTARLRFFLAKSTLAPASRPRWHRLSRKSWTFRSTKINMTGIGHGESDRSGYYCRQQNHRKRRTAITPSGRGRTPRTIKARRRTAQCSPWTN